MWSVKADSLSDLIIIEKNWLDYLWSKQNFKSICHMPMAGENFLKYFLLAMKLYFVLFFY